jgi:predicted SAM-dependent methyltransferase
MKYLNLGCGPKYVKSSDWLNADMLPYGKDVIQCNFLNGIPMESNTFDLVYNSHVLEHFSKKDGEIFIKECYRILNSGGVIRIAMPNLEEIAKQYLNNIEKGMNTEENANNDYDWIMLEMYDQTVRNNSGGLMLDYLTQATMPNEKYVYERIGDDAKKWRKSTDNEEKVMNRGAIGIIKTLCKKPSLIFKGFKLVYLRIVLSKKGYQNYKVGKFRSGGEIHQWMYDRYSLSRLLNNIGFVDITLRTATSSFINEWPTFKLDNPNEKASIFIEAIKK